MRYSPKLVRNAVIALASLAGVQSTLASVPLPPPPLAASSKKDCGLALAGASAIAGLLGATQNNGAATGKWSGFYAGGQLGCAFDDTKWTFRNVTGGFPNNFNSAAGQSASFNRNQAIFGGLAGYNLQFGNVVTGIELSLSSGLQSEITNPLNPFPLGQSQKLVSSIGQIFSATGRLGYVVDPRWMVYSKGGLATANVTANLQSAVFGPVYFSSGASNRMTGWTIGTGVEYQLSKNMVLGAGYDYYNLGTKDFAINCSTCGATPIVLGVNPVVHAVQGRLTYRFD